MDINLNSYTSAHGLILRVFPVAQFEGGSRRVLFVDSRNVNFCFLEWLQEQARIVVLLYLMRNKLVLVLTLRSVAIQNHLPLKRDSFLEFYGHLSRLCV